MMIRLPTSPIKPNILQPSNLAVNNCVVKQEEPDSTDENGKRPGQKRARKSTGSNNNNNNKASGRSIKAKKTMVALDSNHVPFVKHHHSVKKPQTPSVSRRNARERNRVKQVNNGFSTLRQHIPHLKNKTSKVDTLRAAVEYIQTLRRMLGEEGADDDGMRGEIILADSFEEKDQLQMSLGFDDSRVSGTSSATPPRCSSSQSMDNIINPLVYQLPPVSLADFILDNPSGQSREGSPQDQQLQDQRSNTPPDDLNFWQWQQPNNNGHHNQNISPTTTSA